MVDDVKHCVDLWWLSGFWRTLLPPSSGVCINHEAKTAFSSRMHKLCVTLYSFWYKPQDCSHDIFQPHPVEEFFWVIKPSSVNYVTWRILHFLKCEQILSLNWSTICQRFRNRTQRAVTVCVLIGGHYKSFYSSVQCQATWRRGRQMWTVCWIGCRQTVAYWWITVVGKSELQFCKYFMSFWGKYNWRQQKEAGVYKGLNSTGILQWHQVGTFLWNGIGNSWRYAWREKL
jgi:hypothetical protein